MQDFSGFGCQPSKLITTQIKRDPVVTGCELLFYTKTKSF